MEDVLIVDGYNIIGAWAELRALKDLDLERARDRLIEILSDYQGYSGMKVVVVFDAHQVPGLGGKYRQYRLDIIYTKEKETADECIERLVSEWMRRRRQIYVATSDLVEQHVTFGKGALRLSSRELQILVEEGRQEIRKKIRPERDNRRNAIDAKMNSEMRDLFEKWRRGE